MIEAASLSPAFKRGIRERGKVNPTATYGELALRNLIHTGVFVATAVGLATIAAGAMLKFDIVPHDVIGRISHAQEPGFTTNPLAFTVNHLLHNDVPELGILALSVPFAAAVPFAAGGTVYRGFQFFGSLGKDINNKAHAHAMPSAR